VAYRLDEISKTGGSGVIDIKVTDGNMIANNECYARCGPVLAGGKRVFKWKKPVEG